MHNVLVTKPLLLIGSVNGALAALFVEVLGLLVAPQSPPSTRLSGVSIIAGITGITTFFFTVVSMIFVTGRKYGEWTKSNQTVSAQLAALTEAVKNTEHRTAHLERALIAKGILDEDGKAKHHHEERHP